MRKHRPHIFAKPPEERGYHRAPAKRDALIRKLRAQGLGVVAIGRLVGISHQRVCQVLAKSDAA